MRGGPATEDGSIERVALAHADPERARAGARACSERYPPDPNAAGRRPQVIRTGQPELYPEIPDELLRRARRTRSTTS